MAKNKTKQDYQLDTKNIWFPNQKEPDPDNLPLFNAYWAREKKRCMYGFHIGNGQLYIPGFLYFYTVYWKIELDIELPDGRSFKGLGTPRFRDIEWEVFNDIVEAEKQQKLYSLVGSRGFGKSYMCSALVGWMYTFFDNSESLLSAGNADDIKLLAQKVDLGLSEIHPMFQKRRIKNNWKEEVRAGWVDRQTGLPKGSKSRILSRNFEDGNKPMAANGTRPKVHIIDEIGKIPNLRQCLLDSKPCWYGDKGMFSIVIFTGTGGDMEKGEDAGIIFNDPETYDMLEHNDPWEGRGPIGKFMPVTKARNEYKVKRTLYDYLVNDLKYDLEHHPELDVIIEVSEQEKCLEEWVNPRRAKAEGAISTKELISEKAYYPLTPSECFLVVDANDFPIIQCQEQFEWLKKEKIDPLRVKLIIDHAGNIKHEMTNDPPVEDFPVTKDTNKTGVIEVMELPVSNAPYGLYVLGIDPYKVSESDYSDSVGSCYVFKRMTDDMTEPYQYMPVAWYHGRPKSIHDWYENVRRLTKWYNGQAMCENIDYGFIQYMIEKGDQHYLAQGQSFLKELTPGTKHKGQYGLPPTPAMINHWLNSALIYTKEEVDRERDDKGEVIRTIPGVNRIMDKMLLTEMIKYNKDKGNFDRVRAFSIAVAWAKQLDATMPKAVLAENKVANKSKIIRSPFTSISSKKYGIATKSSPFLMRRKNRS